MSDDNWIEKATKNKGALRRKLGVPKGDKISKAKLGKAAKSKSPTERKEATLAETLENLRK